MNTHRTRLITAITTALACLLMLQTPASATVYTSHITGGTSTMVKTGAWTSTFDLAGSGACPSNDMDVDLTATTISVTSLSVMDTLVVAGTTYVIVITRSPTGNTTGTVSGTNVSSLGVGLRRTYYALLPGTPCTPSGTAICTLQASVVLGGTVTAVSTSNTGHWASPGTTVTGAGVCGVPFSTYIGSTLTITSLTLHLST